MRRRGAAAAVAILLGGAAAGIADARAMPAATLLPASFDLSAPEAAVSVEAPARTDALIPSDYGPRAPDDTDAAVRLPDPERYDTFGERVGAVKWEMLGIAAYVTATNLPKTLKYKEGFHFADEGLFGKDTYTLGTDKFAHAFNAQLFSDLIYMRMARKTGDTPGTALTAAVLGAGVQLYGEVYDGFKSSAGFSFQDVAFNLGGSAVSFARHAVPGLKEKLDFRILIVPNDQFYSFDGQEHYRQERFLFALKLAGFHRFEHGPLRLVELQAGYHATGFTPRERARDEPLVRRPFVGIGLNLQQLFFRAPRTWPAKAARTTLQYLQLPYTSVRSD